MDRKPGLNNGDDFIESEEYGPISELDYRFFEYMQEGVIVSTPVYKNSEVIDLIVTYANLIAYKQRKDFKAGFIAKSIRELYDSETVQVDLQKANESISTGRGLKYEIYRPNIDKYFSISAFSPREDIYVTFSIDITKQKKSEERINRERHKLLDIIEFLPDATFVIDKNKEVIAWNHALEKMTGVSKEEILGKNNYEYSIPFYGVKRPIIIDLIFLEEKEIEEKYDYVKREGNTLFAEVFVNNLYNGKGAFVFVKASPLYDAQGNLVGSIESVRDITEAKKAQIALEESRKKYKELVQDANSIIIRLDRTGHITFFNEFAERFFGYKKDEVIGKNIIGTIVPEIESSGRDLKKLINKIIKSPEEYYSNENENITKDGKRVWVSWANRVIYDDKGNQIGLLSVGTDITEKREYEIALRESEEKFRSTIEQSTDGIAIIDEEGKIIEWNKGMERITGYKSKEEINKFVWDSQFDLLPEEEKTQETYNYIKNTITEFLKTGTAEWMNKTLDRKIQRPDGDIRYLQSVTYHIHTKKGAILGSVTRDITEQKEIENALKESEEKFRAVFNNANDAMFLHIIDESRLPGTFIEINDNAIKSLGYTREELLKMSPMDIDAGEEDEIIPVMDELFEKGISTFERVHVAKNGHKFPVEISSHIFKLDNEKLVLSVARDITKRKKAEDKLRYEQNLLNAVLNNIPVAVAVAEAPSGKLIRANDQFEKVWEQPFIPSDNIKDYINYKGYHSDGRPYAAEEWPLARSIKNGEIVEGEEIKIIFEDGNEKILSVSSTPVKNNEGKIILGVVSAVDVTKQINNYKD
ncbi:PAS domain-containing protein [Methanobacterium sp. ACI-7]|uniref:PAS domain-containing protein n=1 Tax=unclassified Methanobacterium TaxID=2627676 RepID=UPI0039C2DAC7